MSRQARRTTEQRTRALAEIAELTERGLTVASAAKRAGVGLGTYYYWAKGKRVVNKKTNGISCAKPSIKQTNWELVGAVVNSNLEPRHKLALVTAQLS